MDEYINKTKFEELMHKKSRDYFDLYYLDKLKDHHYRAIGYSLAADEVSDFPVADVKLIRYGSWSNQVLIDDGFGGKRVGYICSACKQFVSNKGNYCLECGADMRGDT